MSEQSFRGNQVRYYADRTIAVRNEHFDSVPSKGDFVQVDGLHYTVIEVWHSFYESEADGRSVTVYLESIDIADTYAGRHMRE